VVSIQLFPLVKGDPSILDPYPASCPEALCEGV
jgi:hypothetical protein